MVKEWADMVLFANYKTYVVAADDKGKKHKAQGGKRVLRTSHHPCWDAKNRARPAGRATTGVCTNCTLHWQSADCRSA